MEKELEKYNNNLTIKLNSEKEILRNFEVQLNDLYDKLKKNNDKINIINGNNINLNKEINKIINKYLIVINIYLKMFFMLCIIIGITSIGILSKLNFFVMLLFSIISPIICIFMKVYITKILIQRYRNKNKEIFCLNSIINENNIKLEQLKKECINLTNYIEIVSGKYNNKKRKVHLIKTLINKKYNYNTDFTCHNISKTKRYRKIKTRK